MCSRKGKKWQTADTLQMHVLWDAYTPARKISQNVVKSPVYPNSGLLFAWWYRLTAESLGFLAT